MVTEAAFRIFRCPVSTPVTISNLGIDLGVMAKLKPFSSTAVCVEEEEALKELKNNEKIVILKADKGNATVVMNTEDYEEKVNSLLSDECTYEKLPTRPNPVNQITSRINQYVWNLYRNEKINKK